MLEVQIENIVPVTEARDRFNQLVDSVEGTDEMFVMTKNGKPVAILVGVHHLEKLTGENHEEVFGGSETPEVDSQADTSFSIPADEASEPQAPIPPAPLFENTPAAEETTITPEPAVQTQDLQTQESLEPEQTDASSITWDNNLSTGTATTPTFSTDTAPIAPAAPAPGFDISSISAEPAASTGEALAPDAINPVPSQTFAAAAPIDSAAAAQTDTNNPIPQTNPFETMNASANTSSYGPFGDDDSATPEQSVNNQPIQQ